MVGRAITEAGRLGNLRVYLNPEDQAVLMSLWQESELLINGQKIQLVSSLEIQRGGCFIEGEFGSVDSRIETQLALVQENLKTSLVNREEEDVK
jgi:flagellar biosynthesis/type III secretory pathway protein FliH